MTCCRSARATCFGCHVQELWRARLEDRSPLQYLTNCAHWWRFQLAVGPGGDPSRPAIMTPLLPRWHVHATVNTTAAHCCALSGCRGGNAGMLCTAVQVCSFRAQKRSSCWIWRSLRWRRDRSCRVATGRTLAPAAAPLRLDWPRCYLQQPT